MNIKYLLFLVLLLCLCSSCVFISTENANGVYIIIHDNDTPDIKASLPMSIP